MVDTYKGRYDEGPDVLRQKRLDKQKELKLIESFFTISPVITDEPGWDELSVEEKAKSARAMEIYAAMVEVMDRNIGRVIDYLKQTGEYDNTFILFMSDNGAEGSILEAIPILSSNPPVKFFDNSLENMGNKDYSFGTVQDGHRRQLRLLNSQRDILLKVAFDVLQLSGSPS